MKRIGGVFMPVPMPVRRRLVNVLSFSLWLVFVACLVVVPIFR
jgi:hypothetical protein